MTSGVACSTGIMLLTIDIMATVLLSDSYGTPQFLTVPVTRTVIGITWFLSLSLGIWIVVELDNIGCSVNFMFRLKPAGIAVFCNIVQALISFTCYGITYTFTAHSIQTLKADMNSENLLQTSVVIKRLQRNIKLAKLAVLLAVLYFVSHGPSIAMVTASRLFEVSIPNVFVGLAGLFLPLNSLGNCVIYWWRSLEFRRIWREMFSCILSNRVQPG